jgi:hypothetical protein
MSAKSIFEPPAWDERYSGEGTIWSGDPNVQLVAERTDWWRVDAREFDAGGRTFDLVSSQYLHPPDGGMVDVVGRLAAAVAPGGHLLVVGHAPPPGSSHLGAHEPNARHRAMLLAADLLPGLPDDLEPLVVEQRPHPHTRDGETIEINDSVLLARRRT